MRLLAPLLACALLSIPAASGSDSSPDYRWPLDTPRVLTSSFGEFRTGRLHAGVDLRSAVGTKVFAPADGYVSRVRCAPTGYGKAVYVQFTDGRSVVFGHLDDYAPAVRAYVQREQHARESYTVDLYPEATLFPIKRGDLIGLSGQTGIGAPHLHYELRDNNGWPINPCLLGVTWPDTTPPAIRKILVMPKGPDCLLDGDCVPLIVEPRATQQRGRYVCDPVHVTGQVGFGVDVIDTGDNGGGKLGVRTTRVVQDDVEQFRLQIDQFSYDHIRGGAVAYHPYLMNEGRFLLQWRWPGNKAEIFPAPEQDGWLSVNS